MKTMVTECRNFILFDLRYEMQFYDYLALHLCNSVGGEISVT